MFRTLAFLSFGLISLVLGGCGYSTSTDPSVPGQGKLTLANGQPAKSASILLVPLAGKGGVQCGGITGNDGSFTLKTGEKDGIVPGVYMVVVKPRITNQTSEEEAEQLEASLPHKFRDDENSPLTVTVKSAADLQIQLK